MIYFFNLYDSSMDSVKWEWVRLKDFIKDTCVKAGIDSPWEIYAVLIEALWWDGINKTKSIGLYDAILANVMSTKNTKAKLYQDDTFKLIRYLDNFGKQLFADFFDILVIVRDREIGRDGLEDVKASIHDVLKEEKPSEKPKDDLVISSWAKKQLKPNTVYRELMKLGLPENNTMLVDIKGRQDWWVDGADPKIYLQEMADVIVDPDQMDLYKYWHTIPNNMNSSRSHSDLCLILICIWQDTISYKKVSFVKDLLTGKEKTKDEVRKEVNNIMKDYQPILLLKA